MPAAQAFVAHTPHFATAKEKLNSPARKRFELRHNIVRRDCAKLDGWSYTITDRFYHSLYLYNKALISSRISDGCMLFFFVIGFAKLTIIFTPNLRFYLIQTCGFV